MNHAIDLNTLAQQDAVNQLAADLERPASGGAAWTKEYAASGTQKTQPPAEAAT